MSAAEEDDDGDAAAANCRPTIASVPKPVMLAVMSRSGSAPAMAKADDDGVEGDLGRAGDYGRRARPVRPRTDGSRRARPRAKR